MKLTLQKYKMWGCKKDDGIRNSRLSQHDDNSRSSVRMINCCFGLFSHTTFAVTEMFCQWRSSTKKESSSFLRELEDTWRKETIKEEFDERWKVLFPEIVDMSKMSTLMNNVALEIKKSQWIPQWTTSLFFSSILHKMTAFFIKQISPTYVRRNGTVQILKSPTVLEMWSLQWHTLGLRSRRTGVSKSIWERCSVFWRKNSNGWIWVDDENEWFYVMGKIIYIWKLEKTE